MLSAGHGMDNSGVFGDGKSWNHGDEETCLRSCTHPLAWVPDKEPQFSQSMVLERSDLHVKSGVQLPLELFDNEEGEVEKFEEWLGSSKSVPGFSRYYDASGAFVWAKCAAIGYDRDKELYKIEWNDTKKRKFVKRLNLLFQHENPASFRFRIEEARRMREQVEAESRYYNFIAEQPLVNTDIIGLDFLDRIMFLAGAQLSQEMPGTVEDYMEATRENYQMAVRASIVNLMFDSHEGRAILEANNVQQIKCPRPTPQQGCVQLDGLPHGVEITSGGNAPHGMLFRAPFSDLHVDAEKNIPLASTHFLRTIQKYYSELDIRGMLLVDVIMEDLQMPVELREFVEAQDMHLSEVTDTLKSDWVLKMIGMIELIMPSNGDDDTRSMASSPTFGGQEDLGAPGAASSQSMSHQQTMRFVKMMSLTMADQLRTVILTSIDAFVNFWKGYDVEEMSEAYFAGYPKDLIPALDGRSDKENASDEQKDEEEQDGLDSLEIRQKWGQDMYSPCPPAVFRIQMVPEDECLAFFPSLEEVERGVIACFDGIMHRTSCIHDVAAKVTNAVSEDMLAGVELDELFVVEAREWIRSIILKNSEAPKMLMKSFEKYEWIVKLKEMEYVEGLNQSLEESKKEIERFRQVAEAIDMESESEVTFRLLRVDCRQAKQFLIQKSLMVREKLLEKIGREWDMRNMEMLGRFEVLCKRLKEQPDSVEALDEMEQFLGKTENELTDLDTGIAENMKVFGLLQESQFSLSDESVESFWSLQHWPMSVVSDIEDAKKMLFKFRTEFMVQLKTDQKVLEEDLIRLKSEIDEFIGLGDMTQVDDRLTTVQDIEHRLQTYSELSELYQSREEVFSLPQTAYPQIENISKTFEPYANLWKMCSEVMHLLPEWMDGPFTEINAEAVASDCDKWWRTSAKLSKVLLGDPLQVITDMRERLKNFQQYIPMICALSNPGLRDRHWEKISATVGFTVKADASFSVSHALRLELPKFLAEIEETSEFATKEYSLEKAIDKMQSDWAGIEFSYMEWRTTGTHILCALDDIQMLLDDQIVKTQSMRASPYIGPFEDRVRLWETKLNTIQEIVDEWLKCQQGWLYLEPIFGSEDILQQMPNEGRKFHSVDIVWRGIMEKLLKNSEVTVVCSDEELLKNLIESNKLLEQVQKGLNEYLETKRLAFPRFYFLSNDELLEILSETKDPLRVQPFLKKIFEGIDKLGFESNLEVTSMYSEEGEKVQLSQSFNPGKAGGNVEKWLIECEAIMRDTIKDVIKKSFEDYATSERIDWVLQWPGQAIICVDCMYWTVEGAEAVRTNSLADYAERLTEELMKIVNKVRGKLSKLERKVLGSLVVIDVHARDVIAELSSSSVASESDFEWMSQMRYGWEDGEVMVRMINAAIPYGYEYLGVSSRLVITPLTDRCYRTLMGALHLNLGGAPEGPAGTGKTETTKDLAKAIAMQCVVFNCSDGLDYLAMGKFFKGLASSGAWACFDEFNRIDLEVLSVIAQQIQTMQHAKSAKLKTFEFEGTKLSLRDTFSVFITMNPGYAGRSELPDNLKALFRSVAMMVPDYALISEIMLYSSGYLLARDLARKLVATYRLCSEQLSSQSHYDYGMRAVISVLRAAAANKIKDPDMVEDILMLRSIRDVNAPKFLAPDIPLFEGILSDLFPGIDVPETDYTDLDVCLKENCTNMNVQATSLFVTKAHQLYEMILVRHGLMLVGYSFGAKTSIYRSLAGALGDLSAKGLMEENKVQLNVINPKSIYMGQLYGEFDLVSHEWHDGVLANLFRQCATNTSPDRKWVIFDGPVDAIWIENMNTVLDDNKKLCLNSGEIIQMSNSMNMIFEVQDLAVASPATVSRCGMVYVEPTQIGWRPLRDSWMNTLPESVRAHESRMYAMFEWLVDPCIAFVRKNCKESVPTSDINLAKSLMNMILSSLDEFRQDEAKQQQVNPKDEVKLLDGIFVFSVIWSIGASTETEGRTKFSDFLRKLLKREVDCNPDRTDYDLGPGLRIEPPEFKLDISVPGDGSLYDYALDRTKCQWKKWMDTISPEPVPHTAAFHEIIVPTVDTVRYHSLMSLLVTHGVHVLIAGPTGTGKTIYVKDMINRLDKNQYTNIQTAFSAQTNANQVQDIIDSKLDKRRKGIFGPPFGMKCLLFVDDLNMPALEVFGAQPPIELLRQWMDHGGWYDRSDNTFRTIADMQFICSMGPPGGGRNPVTPRLLRHFNLVFITEFDDDSYIKIYSAIVDWWQQHASVHDDVKAKASAIVKSTIQVYNTIRRELLPTPLKSHYTYNMRDLSKVFQGISRVGDGVDTMSKMIRLWSHEVMRVFHDRLINEQDCSWFCGLLKDVIGNGFGCKLENVISLNPDAQQSKDDPMVLRRVLFCDFLTPGADVQKYGEVKDPQKLLSTLEEYLQDYNAQSKTQMDLVLFLYAAEHICRISRVIKQPFGNGLLVGVGGSGRQSLTRIATFMAEYNIFSIEISKSYSVNEWREDIRTVLKKSGAEGNPTVFLFTDSQLKDEAFLEDINNILNTGEVPNLFPKDELMGIMEAVTPRAKKAGRGLSPQELYAYFIDQCRQNLHMVICMSPVGDGFRAHLRKFPSLVNCCTIDWFSEWPEDALKSVASKFLGDVDMESEATRMAVEDMCMTFHQSVRILAADFLRELQRHYYATPTSYLELIQTYKDLLGKKRMDVQEMRRRYEIGLEKLLSAETDVNAMKADLIELQPKLIETGKEVKETLAVVNSETLEAEKKRTVVQGEEAIANEKAAAAKLIKDECEAELAVAMPMLNSAIQALNTLTKSDITEVKAMKNPPAVVKTVMEAVCLMLYIKPKRINDPNNPAKKIDDYWGPSQALLGDPQFLTKLQEYDKDNIPPAIVEKIKPYVELPEFTPENVKKASKAAYGLCCWVRAMEAYDRVAKVVAPKKEKLAGAQAEFDILMVGLNEKKAQLKEVEDRLAALNAKLDEMQAKKQQLEHDVDLCEKKLNRATKLIGGLGGEKSRWGEVVKILGVDFINLTGDVLLSAGFIAYMGAFTASYRQKGIDGWIEQCKSKSIPCSEDFKMVDVLGEPVKIRDWTIDGLPNDSFSIDNGIIVTKARRWPLMIDPQGQAVKWLKNMERKHNLEVMKLTDDDFVRRLENCIQFGTPVLMENVLEELDPTLEPLLLKSVFKQGGTLSIRLGDSTIEYSENFRFYITTKLRNPHYLPEVAVKVTLLNFMITPDGLEDQLLGIVVQRERPELEEEKTKLVVQGAENARQLKEIEDKIIEVLSSSEGNILEDETAISIISSSKTLSNDIAQKQQIARKTEQKIDEARMAYKPCARNISILFFTISDLAAIEPMYQYSLSWFVHLFEDTITKADKSPNVAWRIESLVQHFTYSLYGNVCRSLFEKDKLLFSFMLCVCLKAHIAKTVDLNEFRFLLTGGISTQDAPSNPSSWLPDKLWAEMCRLSELSEPFNGLAQDFSKDPEKFKTIYDSPDPPTEPLPENWQTRLSEFQRLLFLRAIRPDKLVRSIQLYVLEAMGQKYIEPPPFDLEQCYQNSTALTPMIFILSPGSDPMSGLLKYAESSKIQVSSISLGQGQGQKAEVLIQGAQSQGGWVVLQNCHLAVSWLPILERICEGFTMEATNPSFRLWLTSYPSPDFPVAILQNGIKMTNEPPKGLRANVMQSYLTDPVSDPSFFGGVVKPMEFKKLLFGLCFFHAMVQERLKFGPLGWNVPYQFSQPDFVISVRQLHMFLNEFPNVTPLKALKYLTGECNYGGRVTDAHDRRTLMSILSIFYTDEAFDDSYVYSPSGTYYAPGEGDYDDYLDFIRSLPIAADPEVFGLHANADITKDQKETDILLSSILSTQGSESSGATQSKEQVLSEVAVDIDTRLPEAFDVELVQYKFPVDYYESMNTVLCQEIVRFNGLINVIHSSLKALQKALKGLVVMSADLEQVGNAMFDGKVPALWMGKSYPSQQPLGSYINDLIARVEMLSSWIDNGPPACFWISGFYFTHAFLTGVKQNFARKYKIPIDTIIFNYACLPKGNYDTPPDDGAYVKGMFIEGAKWDYETMMLSESETKILFSQAPMMLFSPSKATEQKEFPHYECPLYRTPERRGVLATTGHSTNFVMDLMIPSDRREDHWIRRGVAFLLSLSD